MKDFLFEGLPQEQIEIVKNTSPYIIEAIRCIGWDTLQTIKILDIKTLGKINDIHPDLVRTAEYHYKNHLDINICTAGLFLIKNDFMEDLKNLCPVLTGENLIDKKQSDDGKFKNKNEQRILRPNGKIKTALSGRVFNNNLDCFIDQFTCTFNAYSLRHLFDKEKLMDYLVTYFPTDASLRHYMENDGGLSHEFFSEFFEMYIYAFSSILEEIFGFGVYKKANASIFRYKHTYLLGDDDTLCGRLMIGGNNGTMCLQLTGTGLTVAKENWQNKLYFFSTYPDIADFKYTRIDLAKDFFDGEYTVDKCLEDYQNGGFNLKAGVFSHIEKVGKDWFNEGNNTGRTLYIGSRKGSRYIRCYEKGKQLGYKESKWTRFELELKSHDIIIPLDVVLFPQNYLCSYDAIYNIFLDILRKGYYVKLDEQDEQLVPRTIKSKSKKFNTSFDVYLKNFKRCFKSFFNLLNYFGKSADFMSRLFIDSEFNNKFNKYKFPKSIDLKQLFNFKFPIPYDFLNSLDLNKDDYLCSK